MCEGTFMGTQVNISLTLKYISDTDGHTVCQSCHLQDQAKVILLTSTFKFEGVSQESWNNTEKCWEGVKAYKSNQAYFDTKSWGYSISLLEAIKIHSAFKYKDERCLHFNSTVSKMEILIDYQACCLSWDYMI